MSEQSGRTAQAGVIRMACRLPRGPCGEERDGGREVSTSRRLRKTSRPPPLTTPPHKREGNMLTLPSGRAIETPEDQKRGKT